MAEPSTVGDDLAKLNLGDVPDDIDPAKAAEKAAKKAAKAAAKAAKDAAKAERAAQWGQKATPIDQADPNDPLADKYGDSIMVQSRQVTGRTWTSVQQLSPELAGQTVLVRARCQAITGKGKSAFLTLREQHASCQAVLFVNDTTVSKGMVKYAQNISKESIVDVEGLVATVDPPVEKVSQRLIELKVTAIHVISRAALPPLEVVDAARSAEEIAKGAEEGKVYATVNQDTRLDNRVIDLRTPTSQAIFKVQSEITQLFRESLLKLNFIEIHTPKLLGGASEGGAAVFRLQYFNLPACLAQSPQFYKQMAICADMGRVFEIGPVFRAENSFTHRHLCEFTGLDMEMEIHESYEEVLDVLDALFINMFNGLNDRCATELGVIGNQYAFAPLEYNKEKSLRLTFAEGIKMLHEAGYTDVDPLGDLSTETEKALGKLVKAKYNTDFYMLHRYPLSARPFYTMPAPDDPNYSNSFDIFIRGEEIISGAQRVHDPKMLEERAVACGVPVDQIQAYLDSFKYGAPPHGGCGVGLERVAMLFCGLDNIRKTSMFPRDPRRLAP